MSEDTPAESKDKASNLDLGLSSFLNGGGQEIKTVSGETPSLSEILKKSVELTQSASIKPDEKPEVEISNEFQTLANAGKWQELSKLCEEKLAASRDADKSAKLWWIKSQYETKAIPVSILAPSLNLISKDLLTAPEIGTGEKSTCLSLLSVFSKNLISNNDYELALVFISHLLNNPAAKDANSLLSELEKKVDVDSTFQSNDLVKSEIKALKEKFKLSTFVPLEEKVTASTIPPKPAAAPKKSSFKFVLAMLFLLALIPAVYFMLPGITGGKEFKPSLSTKFEYADQVLIEPQPDRVAGLNHLDALYYEVSSGNNNAQTGSVQDPDPRVTGSQVAVNNPPPYSPPTAKIPNRTPEELESVGANSKDKVNTTYPLEKTRDTESVREQDAEEQIPEIDFPPYRSNKPRPLSEKNAPNYVVIARTRVMKEPSYWAYAGADLKEGDKVKVEEVQGKWLKIKAKNGDIGYILAQDAVKIY